MTDPQDLDFDLDIYHREHRHRPFRFRWAGQVWELPSVMELPISTLDLVEKLAGFDPGTAASDGLSAEAVDTIYQTVRTAFGHRQWDELNRLEPLPISAVFTLFNRWMEWSGVDVGESVSSADSSASTAEPSKRTSTATTGSGSAKRSTAPRKTASRRGRS